MKDLLNSILSIAKNAGDTFSDNRNFEVHEKSDISNIVTSMDIAIQNMVLSQLQKLLPQASVFAEEEDRQEMNDGYVWVVDPIDGTTNYAYDYKFSCISIALLNHKEPCLAVVYNPYLKEAFYAIKDQGAYCNDKKIKVTTHSLSSSVCTIGTSPYYKEYADITFERMKKVFKNCRDIRRSGSAALDLCYLAAGRIDAFYEQKLSPWDYAAGTLIVKEAGGIIDSLDCFCFDQPISIVAGNPVNYEDFKNTLEE